MKSIFSKKKALELAKGKLEKGIASLKKKKSVIEPQPLSQDQEYRVAISTAGSVLHKAKLIWLVSVLSLPLDFLLIEAAHFVQFRPEMATYTYPLLYFCCLCAFLFSFRSTLFANTQKFSSYARKKKKLKRYLYFVAIGLVLFVYTVEFLMQQGDSAGMILFQLFVYGSMVWAMIGQGRNSNGKSPQQELRVILNRDFYLGGVFPILCARAILPLGLLSALASSTSSLYLNVAIFAAISGLLLLELEPVQSHFIVPCRRCSLPLPLQLFRVSACPRCVDNSQ